MKRHLAALSLLVVSLATGSAVAQPIACELASVGSAGWPGDEAQSIVVADGLAYLATGYEQSFKQKGYLRVVDVESPGSPTLVGAVELPDHSFSVAVAGAVAYVASDNLGGFQVIDVSDPSRPTPVAAFETPGAARAVAVQDGLAYVLQADDGLLIIDVSTPSSLALLSSLELPNGGGARDIAASGSLVFVANNVAGLHVIGVSDSFAPTILGTADVSGADGVTVVEDIAYVATGIGLELVNVADPSSPAVIGSAPTPPYPGKDVAVLGGIAYVAGDLGGLFVIDVSIPSAPLVLGSVETQDRALGVTVVGSLAYVADENAGLQIIDVEDCPGCYVDVNGDDSLNILDFIDFQSDWLAEEVRADCDENRDFDILDFVCFQFFFGLGCS